MNRGRTLRMRWQTVAALGFVLALATTTLAAKPNWEPIAKADLEATQCARYPGEAAEILFDHVTLIGEAGSDWYKEHRRIKVYNANAAQKAGIFVIGYSGTGDVWDLAARVTKPDGASTEYGKESFLPSVAYKGKEGKFSRRTIALANVSAGDIVEYTWTGYARKAFFGYHWWYVEQSLPVREYTLLLRSASVDSHMLWFNLPTAKIGRADGRDRMIATDIPPFHEEPDMPAERDVRGWVAVFSTPDFFHRQKFEDIWSDISSYEDDQFQRVTKPNGAIKEKVAQLLQGATRDEEKVQRLYAFCQQEIANLKVADDASLQAVRSRLNRASERVKASEIVARKAGFEADINVAFAALCRAARFQVQLVSAANRSKTTYIKHSSGYFFLEETMIAVKWGDTWHYYSPGSTFVPFGLLDKDLQGAPGLQCYDDKFEFIAGPVGQVLDSVTERKGKFVLDESGNLEGSVELTLTGLAGVALKREWSGLSGGERTQALIAAFCQNQPTGELTDIQFSNTDDANFPVRISYKVKIPGYADTAGDRLIVMASVFQKGVPARFTEAERKYNICFDYPSIERDSIELTLPAGFELDAPSAPADVGTAQEPLRAKYVLARDHATGIIIFKRELIQGDKGFLAIRPGAYKVVKQHYDAIATSDAHTLVLKPVSKTSKR